jgi:beta-glucosidase
VTKPEKRIEVLLKRMNLEEKVSMLAGIDFWRTRSIERLGIPSIKVSDGPHGVRAVADDDPNCTLPATCFPTGVGIAATWNIDLVQRVGEVIGEEVRARGYAVLLGPCVNIHRSPLGGRNFESYSEDPYLSSRMAVAHIRGVQSRGVGTSVKHFALNNSEFQRMTISSEADERAMREIYFPSFEKAVREAGTRVVMCSYNRLNGTYASENKWLLTDILKDEWGFQGFVVSDWFAVHSTAPAAISGVDLEMPGPARYFDNKLAEAVRSGEVDEKAIDDKVRRILGVMAATGAFDDKAPVAGRVSDVPEHGKLAREVAEESIVLLKNENGVLPLDVNSLRSVAVIGPNAAAARIEGGGSSAVEPYYSVSPLEGLKGICKNDVKLSYEQGCRNNIFALPLDSAYVACGEGEPGLAGEYFDNNDFSGNPVATRTDKDFKLMWMSGTAPVPETKNGDFSIRWRGFFKATATGRYKFGLATNGWGRIYIDNKLVCGNWGDRTVVEFLPPETAGEITLESGQTYPITIEYCKNPYTPVPMRSIRIGCDLPLPPDLLQRAVAAASRCDAAVVFAGLTEEYESEGFDRKTMDLPPNQLELIRKVAGANPNTIVVLNNGAPLAMADWIDDIPAVVEAWYPGQECGNAIAGVLFGVVSPSGKLPDTFPRRYEDNPAYKNYPGENGKVSYEEGIFVGYRHYDARGIEPLFPFGYGLSYTDFEYGNLRVSPAEIKSGENISVSIDIKNTGNRQGKEVVQLYVRDVASKLPRPPRELKGFRKISLLPGETKTVDFILDEEALSFYDPEIGGWVAEPGQFEVQVGSSSRDIRAKGAFTLKS